ncbi:hypothetical protein M8J75_010718 [Diaphorina citri]|nr:hypothetical protein M8J75_010718 [Diaphorina citri]
MSGNLGASVLRGGGGAEEEGGGGGGKGDNEEKKQKEEEEEDEKYGEVEEGKELTGGIEPDPVENISRRAVPISRREANAPARPA